MAFQLHEVRMRHLLWKERPFSSRRPFLHTGYEIIDHLDWLFDLSIVTGCLFSKCAIVMGTMGTALRKKFPCIAHILRSVSQRRPGFYRRNTYKTLRFV